MGSMNKQIIENTNPAQKEWNTCLVTRNKQLTKELKEFRTVSAAMGCSSTQLLAMSQLFRLQTAPVYGIIKEDYEWDNLFSLIDVLYDDSLALSLPLYECKVTPHELRLCYLIRARLKNKALAVVFNITVQSVIKAKQRLKQKLGLLPVDDFDKYIQKR